MRSGRKLGSQRTKFFRIVLVCDNLRQTIPATGCFKGDPLTVKVTGMRHYRHYSDKWDGIENALLISSVSGFKSYWDKHFLQRPKCMLLKSEFCRTL